MLKILCSVIALVPLATAPATAQSATAALPTQVGGDVDARIDAALEAAKKAVLAKDMDRKAYNELVAAIRAGYSALQTATPNADTVRTRLVNAIDDIYARGATAAIQAEEFETLRIDALDARLDNAIQIAMGDPANADHLKRIIDHLTRLVDAAKALDPEMGNVRTRVQAMVDELTKKARRAAADLQPVMMEVSAARAMRSTTILERRAVAKTITPSDFARARNHVSDHMVLLTRTDPSAREIQQKLVAAIDSLEKRAAGAGLTRDDFNELRSQLTARARAAASPK